MSRPVHEVDLNHTRHSIGNHAEKVFLLLFSRGMRAHSHSAPARIVSPSLGTRGAAADRSAQTETHVRTRSHAAAGAATRDDASACRTSHMRLVGSRDELRCPLVRRHGDFMNTSWARISLPSATCRTVRVPRGTKLTLNTSHAAMRHLMRHGGLGGGRRLRFAGHPGTAPCGMDPNVSKPARCRQWRSARAYRRITAERHVRTTAPPCTPGKDRGRSSDECAVEWFSVQRIHKHHRAACTFMDWITPACPSLAAAERPIRAVMGAALETVTRCDGRCLRSCRLIEQIQQ